MDELFLGVDLVGLEAEALLDLPTNLLFLRLASDGSGAVAKPIKKPINVYMTRRDKRFS